MKKVLPYILAIVLTGFGLLTLFLSTSVIFDLFNVRESEGNYVLFVVWSNFISSIIYLFAAYGIVKRKKWATLLLAASAGILVAAFIGLQFHMKAGGIYETKTVSAMIFRIAATLLFVAMAYSILKYKKNIAPKIFNFFFLLFFAATSQAQTNFSVVVQPHSIPGLPGLQSFAAAQNNGKWVLIGGRTEGLHQRQPTNSFLSTYNNTNIYVVDPITANVWSTSVNSLAAPLKEQLQSTNMNFYGDGNKMYITGGYGYSATIANHKTYASLIVIELPGLINAIINNTSITSYFRQLNDNMFAVTGGQLEKLGNMFLLVGGQKFDGRYNPNNGPSFTQEYSNQIRQFRLNDDGVNLSISHQNNITDINQLHRRDYNLAPQVFPNRSLGYTAFSGVFQIGVNLPFLNSVDIDTISYTPNTSFNQLLNHYHSGKLSVYDSLANSMHTIFLGGMAQFYYDAGGNLIQDNEVPFVSTIGKVTRIANGSMTEMRIGNLSGLIGSGAEVLVNHSLPLYANEVIKLNNINQDTILAGYLVGGIQSSALNIFNINTGTQSVASNATYKILLVKTAVLPVKLVYFRGTKQTDGNLLEWKTASEQNNDRFEIERSADGRQFTAIASVPGSGSSSSDLLYSYKDSAPLNGLNYYRLKQINVDGSHTYSEIIIIRFEGKVKSFLLYPNPVNEMLIVEFDNAVSGDLIIKIFDVNGHQLIRQEKSVSSRQLYINTSRLPAGSYFIEIEVNKTQYTNKFIKN